jgi:DNA-binding GntR family transcriptional regulator
MVYRLSAALPHPVLSSAPFGVDSNLPTIYNIFDNMPFYRSCASPHLLAEFDREFAMDVPSLHIDAERTLNASAFLRIRADILSCQLLPNERLRVEGLRERYGMGASPIREALMRLEAEGLVELQQNRGFKVSEVSPRKLADLMRTRIEIESIALRWTLEKGDLEWEANLISSFHRLSMQTKLSESKPGSISSVWLKEHADFHAALLAACDSETLLLICSRLFEQAERYVTLSIISNGPRRDDVTEHKQLMRAALSRDVGKTLELNRAHINRTLGKAAAWLADHPEPVNLRLLDRKAK